MRLTFKTAIIVVLAVVVEAKCGLRNAPKLLPIKVPNTVSKPKLS
jgi:hypothetical protein